MGECVADTQLTSKDFRLLVVGHPAGRQPLSVSQSDSSLYVCASLSVITERSGYKPLLVSPSESNLCVHINLLSQCSLYTSHNVSVLLRCNAETSHSQFVRKQPVCSCHCCHDAVWKQVIASQSVRKQPVYACQPVVIVQSGNEPLSVCQRAACVCISVCCDGAVLR